MVHRVKAIVLVWQAVGFWGDEDTTHTAAVPAGGKALDGIQRDLRQNPHLKSLTTQL